MAWKSRWNFSRGRNSMDRRRARLLSCRRTGPLASHTEATEGGIRSRSLRHPPCHPWSVPASKPLKEYGSGFSLDSIELIVNLKYKELVLNSICNEKLNNRHTPLPKKKRNGSRSWTIYMKRFFNEILVHKITSLKSRTAPWLAFYERPRTDWFRWWDQRFHGQWGHRFRFSFHTQWLLHSFMTKAGPKVRAGLKLAPVNIPCIMKWVDSFFESNFL